MYTMRICGEDTVECTQRIPNTSAGRIALDRKFMLMKVAMGFLYSIIDVLLSFVGSKFYVHCTINS